jgi:hypothetical protein
MAFLTTVKPKAHYATKQYTVLTPEEQQLYINSPKEMIGVYLSAEDVEYIRENKLNISRIGFFLIHEWLVKKRTEWGE